MIIPPSQATISGDTLAGSVPAVHALRSPFRRKKGGGFSLVEVTMAVGIISFAFLTTLGLVPTGLQTFRSAIDTSVGGQIFQRVINEAQQTDFDKLASSIRYFDDQGNESAASEAAAASKSIYHVNTRVLLSTTLTGAAAANDNIATITVQIANNPGNVSLTKGSDGLWTARPGVAFSTRSTMVARNK